MFIQPVKKFPKFYGIRRFTTSPNVSISTASSIQSTLSQLIFFSIYIKIFSSHLRLDFSWRLSPSSFSTRMLYAPQLLWPKCLLQQSVLHNNEIYISLKLRYQVSNPPQKSGQNWCSVYINNNNDIWYILVFLTAVVLTPDGSSTVHIYTQTLPRTTQLTTEQHN